MNQKIIGLNLMLIGSFLSGSSITLLLTDIYLRTNKKYKIVRIN